jgi:hypothetical protein
MQLDNNAVKSNTLIICVVATGENVVQTVCIKCNFTCKLFNQFAVAINICCDKSKQNLESIFKLAHKLVYLFVSTGNKSCKAPLRFYTSNTKFRTTSILLKTFIKHRNASAILLFRPKLYTFVIDLKV